MTETFQRIGRVAVAVAALILMATATAKLVSVWKLGGPVAGSLGHPSLVVPWLSEGWVLIIAALAEYILAAVILLSKSMSVRFGTLAWFSVVCLLYRYVLHAADWEAPCNCTGVWNQNHQQTADMVGVVLLCLLTAIGWFGILGVVTAHFAPRMNWQGAQKPDGTRLPAVSKASALLRNTAGFFVLIFISSSGKGQSIGYYEIQLQISQTNLYYTNSYHTNTNRTEAVVAKERTFSYTARCVFGPSKWLIETHFSPSATHTYHFDGTNIYHTTELKPNRSRSLEKKLGKAYPFLSQAEVTNSSDWVFLTITPGEHPLSDFGANLPWLAFCSGHYLRSENRLIPLAGAKIRHVAASFGFKDNTTSFPDALGLPRKLELLASVGLLKKSPLHQSLIRGGRTENELQIALNPVVSFPERFLAARYEVLSHTNLNGQSIPTEFSYAQFLPGSKGVPLLTLAVLGKVSSIHPAETPTFALSTPQRHSVVDYRFRHKRKLVDSIRYSITNGVVLDEHDPRLQSLYESAASRAPIDPVIKARLGIYGLFLALAAGPVLAGGWWYMTKLTKKKKQKKGKCI